MSNRRFMLHAPQPGHMFCTGVTELYHARCVCEEEEYALYEARIKCRATNEESPTVLGIFRQALEHDQTPVEDGVYMVTAKVRTDVYRRWLTV